jgi:hypothetical protein
MMSVQETLSLPDFLTQEEQTYVLYSAEPDYLDEEVHLSAESIIRPDVTVHFVYQA